MMLLMLRHDKYVGLPAPKCGVTVIACHQLLSGAIKCSSVSIFLKDYHTTIKKSYQPHGSPHLLSFYSFYRNKSLDFIFICFTILKLFLHPVISTLIQSTKLIKHSGPNKHCLFASFFLLPHPPGRYKY